MNRFFKSIKKNMATVLIFALLISLTSCGGKGSDTYGSKTDNIKQDLENGINELLSMDPPYEIEDDTTEEGTTEDTTEETTEVIPGSTGEYIYDDRDNQSEEDKKFNEYTEDYYKDTVTADTLTYNFDIYDSGELGIERPTATWGDLDSSVEAIEEGEKDAQEELDELHEFDRSKLNNYNKVTYDLMERILEQNLASYKYMDFYEPFSPNNGIQVNINTYFTEYHFNDKQDIEDYIYLIGSTKELVEAYLVIERRKADNGRFMSEANCEKVIGECDDLINDPKPHFILETFEELIDESGICTASEKKEYSKRVEQAINDGFIPAFQELKEVMEEYKGKGLEEGYNELPGYTDYYEYVLRNRTSSLDTAADVKRVLENRLSEISTEIYGIYFEDPDGYQYYVDNTDTIFHKADDEMTAEEIIDELMEDCKDSFPDLGTIKYTVKPFPKCLETVNDNTVAYYLSPRVGTPDENMIRTNNAFTEGRWLTLAHEGIPGHMFQHVYFVRSNPDLIRYELNFVGYAEGWAVYSSNLTYKYYEFDESKYAETIGKLAKIDEEYNYLIMALCDVMVNGYGYSKSQLSDYMNEHDLNSAAASDIYESVIGDPGIYQSYSYCYYKVQALRDKAEQSLGRNFDEKKFHEALIQMGDVTFEQLEENIDRFIEENS